MSMGMALGLSTLWKTWLDDKDHLFTASVLSSMYYVSKAGDEINLRC